MSETPLLAVEGLTKTFLTTRGLLSRGHHVTNAVHDVSFSLAAGGSLGIVGESGSGKTTIARLITGLERATAGTIVVAGRDRSHPARKASERRRRGRELQIVLQDPY